MIKKKQGFTLIELLVTISIMAILSSIAVVSYSGITAKTRDSQRIKDLEAIKQGLELYKADIHNYPSITDFPLDNKPTELVGVVGVGITYLNPVPTDSNSANNYYYSPTTISGSVCDNFSSSTACLKYILCAKKEGADTAYDLSACNTFDCGGTGIKCNIGISSQ